MRRIVVDIQNSLLSDAVADVLRTAGVGFVVYAASRPGAAAELCRQAEPWALIMEVAPTEAEKLPSRLATAEQIRKWLPECKVVLVVDENSDKILARQVCRAKKDGLIDQFIYSSISSEYLSAVIDSL